VSTSVDTIALRPTTPIIRPNSGSGSNSPGTLKLGERFRKFRGTLKGKPLPTGEEVSPFPVDLKPSKSISPATSPNLLHHPLVHPGDALILSTERSEALSARSGSYPSRNTRVLFAEKTKHPPSRPGPRASTPNSRNQTPHSYRRTLVGRPCSQMKRLTPEIQLYDGRSLSPRRRKSFQPSLTTCCGRARLSDVDLPALHRLIPSRTGLRPHRHRRTVQA